MRLLLIAIALFVLFLVIALGDSWSTAFGFRYNNKYTYDKKFRQKVQRQMRKSLKKDETKAEMNSIPRRLIKKYGGDRACLYIFLLGYCPLSLFLLYMLRTDFEDSVLSTTVIIAFMVGVLYRQIARMLTLKQRFGIDMIKSEVEEN